MQSSRPLSRLASWCLCAGVVASAGGGVIAQEWKPTKNVDIVVASGAGGSSDRSARVVQKLLQANPAFASVSVTNRGGGGGTVAWTFLAQQPADPHYIATFSPTIVTNQILGVGKLTYNDFTPLSILLREYVVLTVNAESPLKSRKALIERLRKDPTSVSFAFASSPGNHNHVVIGMVMKAAGADPRKAKVVTEIRGRRGDGDAGRAYRRACRIARERTPASARGEGPRHRNERPATPEWGDGGAADAQGTGDRLGVLQLARLHRAKGLTAAQIAFWEQAFARAVRAEEWKKDVEQNAWAEDFMGNAATRKHLDQEHALLTRLLDDLGVTSEKR